MRGGEADESIQYLVLDRHAAARLAMTAIMQPVDKHRHCEEAVADEAIQCWIATPPRFVMTFEADVAWMTGTSPVMTKGNDL